MENEEKIVGIIKSLRSWDDDERDRDIFTKEEMIEAVVEGKKINSFKNETMEIETVLGLRIEQIAWMKQYFEEHCIPMVPPKEFINQKLRECLSKQED